MRAATALDPAPHRTAPHRSGCMHCFSATHVLPRERVRAPTRLSRLHVGGVEKSNKKEIMPAMVKPMRDFFFLAELRAQPPGFFSM